MSIAYRPSHADAVYDMKYGVRSVQGGRRSSARETIGRELHLAPLLKKILEKYAGTEVLAYVSQVHEVTMPEHLVDYESLTLDQVESNIVRCPDPVFAEKMIAAIDAVRVKGDSDGGVVTCIARNVSRGLGTPVFDKLEALLAKAALSLPATKVRFRLGVNITTNSILTNMGGSGQEQIGLEEFRRSWKLILDKVTRDTCVVPQAVPMAEAMVALVLVEQLMSQDTQCNLFPINPSLQEPLFLTETSDDE